MKYIALLRGINISGKNKIAMNDLKKFTTLGYKEVTTYLNSGNVVFESDIEDKNTIRNDILVVNINNYIGESTNLEIEYAKKLGKEIIYYTD